jgi:hypothetical protein
MKKLKLVILVVVMSLVVVMPSFAKEKVTYGWGHSGVGSTYYMIVVAISSLMDKYSDRIKVMPIPVTPGPALTLAMQDKKFNFSLYTSFQILNHQRGLEGYKGRPYDGLRILWPTHSANLQPFVKKGTVKMFTDLEGKKVCTYTQASTGGNFTRAVLQAAGVKATTILYLASTADQNSALIDGTVAATFLYVGIPSPNSTDLTNSIPCDLLSIDDALWKKLEAMEMGFSRLTVPKGTFKGIDYDVSVIGSLSYTLANKEVPDDIVYEIVKIFFEHQKEAGEIHAINLETGKHYVELPAPAPYHPGALKYYKEKGWLK